MSSSTLAGSGGLPEARRIVCGPKPVSAIPPLTTHTPLIKGLEAHPLNQGGGLSKTPCFTALFIKGVKNLSFFLLDVSDSLVFSC